MNPATMTLEQIRLTGLRALSRDLGSVGLVRFLQQFEMGYGDYTTERHRWLGERTVQDVAQEIEHQRKTASDFFPDTEVKSMSSVTFLGQEITRQQVIGALNQFDSQYLDTNDYDSWLDKGTYRYAIRYSDRLYPCKFILSLASGFDMSDFSGGKQTNRVFRGLGFEVINKP